MVSGNFVNPFSAAGATGASTNTAILNPDTTNGLIEVLATGLYTAQAGMLYTASFAAEKVVRVEWAVGNLVGQDFADMRWSESFAYVHSFSQARVGSVPGSDYVRALFSQTSGANKTLDKAHLLVIRLSAL